MKTIWKFSLYTDNVQQIEMPGLSHVLCFQKQDGEICIWAEVNDELPKVTRTFKIVMTGEELPDEDLRYIGTVQDGAFVWHLFEIIL